MTVTNSPAQPAGGVDQHRLTFHWWHLLIALAALIVVGLVLFVTIQPVQVLPRMTLAPGYALVDQDGNQLTSEDPPRQPPPYHFPHPGRTAPFFP